VTTILVFLSARSTTSTDGGDWWNTSWKFRQAITIYNTAGDLTNYQLKLILNASNVGPNFNWTNNGKDIRFVNASNNELNYWIEYWNSSSKIAYVWVNVTYLPNNTNTTIYMYYGNPNAISKSDDTKVFIDIVPDLRAYWKFENSGKDYSNNSNSVSIGSGPVWISGKFGTAIKFWDDYYGTVYDDDSLDFYNFTFIAWVKKTQTAFTHILNKDVLDGYDDYAWGSGDNNCANRLKVGVSTADYIVCGAGNIFDGNWHFLVAQRDDSGQQLRVWIDGVVKNTTYAPSGLVTGGSYDLLVAGYWWNNFGYPTPSGNDGYNISLDEVMMFGEYLDDNTILNIYNNYYFAKGDKLYVRKYVDQEPTYTIGGESSQAKYIYNQSTNIAFFREENKTYHIAIPYKANITYSYLTILGKSLHTPFNYSENFSTTTYKDSGNADWNTTLGRIKMKENLDCRFSHTGDSYDYTYYDCQLEGYTLYEYYAYDTSDSTYTDVYTWVYCSSGSRASSTNYYLTIKNTHIGDNLTTKIKCTLSGWGSSAGCYIDIWDYSSSSWKNIFSWGEYWSYEYKYLTNLTTVSYTLDNNTVSSSNETKLRYQVYVYETGDGGSTSSYMYIYYAKVGSANISCYIPSEEQYIISKKINNDTNYIASAYFCANYNNNINGSVKFYLSSNGGNNWELVNSCGIHNFSNVGNDLRWKISLSTTNKTITPYVENLNISVDYAYSTNPYMDKLNDSSIDWSRNGTFTAKDIVYLFLENAVNNCSYDTQGFCNIPLIFHSDTAGLLQLLFDIGYNNKQPTINKITLNISNLGATKDERITLNVTDDDNNEYACKISNLVCSISNNLCNFTNPPKGRIWCNDTVGSLNSMLLNYTITNNSYLQNVSFNSNLAIQRIYKKDILTNYGDNFSYKVTHYNKYSGTPLVGESFSGNLQQGEQAILYSEWKGDWLNETWQKFQDTSYNSSLERQYLKVILNVTNTIDMNFTNVNWTYSPTPEETCVICTNLINVSANSYNDTEYAVVYGDWLEETRTWKQLVENQTIAGRNAWIREQIDIKNIKNMDFTNIDTNLTPRENWTCYFINTSINISALGTLNITKAQYCNRTNVVTKNQSPNIIRNNTVVVDKNVGAYFYVYGQNTDPIVDYKNVLVQANLSSWAVNTSPYIFTVNLSSGESYNLTVNITGKPAIETGYTFIKTQVGGGEKNIYSGTVSIYDSAVSEREVWYYVPKSRLQDYETGVSKTFFVDDKVSGFSIQETSDYIIFKVPTTFGSSSLEPGTHTFKITYWTAGALPSGGGGGAVIVETLKVIPEKVTLNITRPGEYTVKFNITWSGTPTTLKFDYTDELMPYITFPKKGQNIEIKGYGNVTTINVTFFINQTELAQQLTVLTKKITGKLTFRIEHLGAIYVRYVPVEISIYKKAPAPTPTPICGNKVCEPGENWLTCPEDCPIPDYVIKLILVSILVLFLVFR